MATFGPSRGDQSRHLLLLPPDTRALIYLYLGLPRDAVIYAETNIKRPRIIRRGAKSCYRPPPPFPWNSEIGGDLRDIFSLLLSCRVLHQEVSALLLGGNTIVVHDLNALARMTPISLKSLTWLKIHVNQTIDCMDHFDGIHGLDSGPPGRYSGYLDESCICSQEFLSQWDRVLSTVATHSLLERLELWLICDCNPGDIDIAERIVAPLRRLRGLKNCHIRLGSRPNDALRTVARRTVEETRAISALRKSDDIKRSQPQFRFSHLPIEIRLQVLTYTDLVTPWRYVEWVPTVGYYIRLMCEESKSVCPPDCPHNECRFTDCWVNTPKADSGRSGCFCSRYHASYSDSCNCWCPPASLFLVSRSFSEDCQTVFYSYNEFSVSVRDERAEYDLELNPFLNALSCNMLSCLRWLQIDLHSLYRKLQPTGNVFGPMGDPWPQTMADLQSHLQLQHLHIYADMQDDWQDYLELKKSYQKVVGRMEGDELDPSEVRGLVNVHVWPAHSEEIIKGTRQLLVSLETGTSELMYYSKHQSDSFPAHVSNNYPDSSHIHRQSCGQSSVVQGYWFNNSGSSVFSFRR